MAYVWFIHVNTASLALYRHATCVTSPQSGKARHRLFQEVEWNVGEGIVPTVFIQNSLGRTLQRSQLLSYKPTFIVIIAYVIMVCNFLKLILCRLKRWHVLLPLHVCSVFGRSSQKKAEIVTGRACTLCCKCLSGQKSNMMSSSSAVRLSLCSVQF